MKSFFQKYKPNTVALVVLVIAAILVALLLPGMYYLNARVKPIDLTGIEEVDSSVVTYHIDESVLQPEYIYVRGYAYIPGEKITGFDQRLVVIDDVTGAAYQIPTTMVTREDVTSAVNDGINYDAAGFEGAVKMSKVPEQYTVKLLYMCNGHQYLIDIFAW